jgi:hypothetical protein
MYKIKIILSAILIIALLIGLSFATEMGNVWWQRFFGEKYENVERDVWENTNSRINGATQEINKRMIEFKSAGPGEREAIAQYLRGSYPDLDPNKINDPVIRDFFRKIKYGNY